MGVIDKNMVLEDLDFSVRTWKCLKKAGVATLGDLLEKSPADLLEIPSLGNKSLREIEDKLRELGLDVSGFEAVGKRPAFIEDPEVLEVGRFHPGAQCPAGGRVAPSTTACGLLWAEVRNNFFESGAEIREEDGDVLAKISIDAWKTNDENEDGAVIACVLLSKHGDVLVDYHDHVARLDEVAQEAIAEAKQQLRDYFLELRKLQEDLNDTKTDRIVYFGEGHFKTREELREIAVAAAEDFISKVNKPNGRHDSKHCFTYDFGSPWDELDMYAEYMEGGDNDRKSWWTVCSLYTKGESPDMTAVQSVESISDVNDIATNVLELVEELDCQIEIEFASAMREKLAEAKTLEDVLNNANERGVVDKVTGDPDMEL